MSRSVVTWSRPGSIAERIDKPARGVREDREHPSVHETLEVDVAIEHVHRDRHLAGGCFHHLHPGPGVELRRRRAALAGRRSRFPPSTIPRDLRFRSLPWGLAESRLTDLRSARRIRAVGPLGPRKTQEGGSMPKWLRTLARAAGCARAGGGGLWETAAIPAAATAVRRRSAPRDLQVGVAFDIGGIGDKSFNDAAKRGSRQAASTTGLVCEANTNSSNPTRRVEPRREHDRARRRREQLVVGDGFRVLSGINENRRRLSRHALRDHRRLRAPARDCLRLTNDGLHERHAI